MRLLMLVTLMRKKKTDRSPGLTVATFVETFGWNSTGVEVMQSAVFVNSSFNFGPRILCETYSENSLLNKPKNHPVRIDSKVDICKTFLPHDESIIRTKFNEDSERVAFLNFRGLRNLPRNLKGEANRAMALTCEGPVPG
jgi:hypothetical protein